MHFTYTVRSGSHTKVWDGFQRVEGTPRTEIQAGTILAVAWFDGEPELWYVRDQAGIDQLRKYYEADWGPGRAPIDTYLVRTSDRFSGGDFAGAEVL